MENRNVVLTGVPRSGTTLTCYLLNKLPDTVALHEPMLIDQSANIQSHELICDEISQFYEQTRKSLRENGTAISKHVGGRIPDNPKKRYSSLFRLLPNCLMRPWTFFGKDIVIGLRKSRVSRGLITVEKTLSSDFLLCIKHNAGFTALLESLHRRYLCYAVVRNPLPVLASWNSIDGATARGHIPAAEHVDEALAQKLAQISDLFERQIYILSWFFERFHTILPRNNVVRYEDIVASDGRVLKVITDKAIELNETLENKNKNKLYNRKLMLTLGEKLLKRDGTFWEFYSKESVEQLLKELDA